MTTDEYFNQWLKEQEGKIKTRTHNRYDELIATHIKPSFDGVPIRKVTKEMVERYISEYLQCQAGLADNSVLQIVGVIKRAFKQATSRGIIKTNPTLDITLKHRQKKIDAFTEREQKKLERFIMKSGRARNYGILIALYTGLRIGELLALTWDDVDMRNATLSISKTVGNLRISKGEKNPYLGTPKTAAGVRVIPYPKQLTPLFRLLKSTGGEYVISTIKGGYVQVNSYQKSFGKILKYLKISHKGFHSLRHTYATRALESGADMKTLSEMLGHSSPTVTLARYAHSTEKQKLKLTQQVGSRLKRTDFYLEM
ncbi:MAG: site-specific integrase [Clostridia bacterium]|nr:site-specific integrase [Clostridia bacterium]